MMQRPQITISSLDAVRLEKILGSLSYSQFPNKDALQEEIDRADIVEPKEMPDNIVTMNSTVTFTVLSSGKEFSKTLVYPKAADGSEDKVSVLAPVGSALLGLKEGDRIDWPKPDGDFFSVSITKVDYQPERAGEFQR
ncbi:nucleoside diphosphate kinase regulator [Marinomonas sp. RSW2]|uniref:Nucleoside diphosphate kinase regulator n=1 Tax=Marinomonas maritima TaxID=2940935 RepID=A0ABT5WD54_9GAMM|nr:nucleoside diphosphate kinase regulator [Marinomonas maritima]MDE8602758.1 nucleoside diphosphate kinase regulator [Marinomonas maritima]